MLNLVSLADIPEATVVRSRMGTLLGRVQMPVPRSHVKELAGPARASAEPVATKAFVPPQGCTKAALFGNGAQVAGLAKLAWQPISKVSYAQTTRIAALKGSGALGPHPARDPV